MPGTPMRISPTPVRSKISWISSTDLSRALDEFAACLRELGRRDEALQVIKESVQIRRILVASAPATYEPDLTDALTELALSAASGQRAFKNRKNCWNRSTQYLDQ
jgi:hypothetical protein